MTIVLYALIHAATLVFLTACVVRAVSYAKQPMHLRWELYPVPHEDPQRVVHGGSYFEEADWQTKPTRFNLLGELRFMVPEILFMKGLWEWNRALWVRSFPFHFGLYLLAGTIGLVVPVALLPGLATGALASPLRWLYTLTGLCGLSLAILGACLLLLRRLTAEDLKPYTTPGDIFNLCAFLAACGCLLAGFLLRSPGFPSTVAVARAVLTFDTTARIPGLLALGLALAALLAAYLPFTHMSHFIGKYFTYHAVRWNDRPNLPGGAIEQRLAEYLSYKPTWAAAHIGADGTRTWADVATTNPAAGVKK